MFPDSHAVEPGACTHVSLAKGLLAEKTGKQRVMAAHLAVLGVVVNVLTLDI
jgi:hypothetical protein